MLKDVSKDEIEKALAGLIGTFYLKNMLASFDYAQRFDWNNIARQVTQVYSELISNI